MQNQVVGKLFQLFVPVVEIASSLVDELVEFVHLMHAEGTLDFGRAHVETDVVKQEAAVQ